jgi:hypothetical protein
MFANKTQSSLNITLTSLSICGIFRSSLRHLKGYALSLLSKYVVFFTQGKSWICLLSHPITNKAYVEFMVMEIAHTYLQCIYCLVKLWIQSNSSYN